ncbi:hypothetical protein [Chamaesiphon minutus]|uniref:Uncharacterized protein n=1 Tax=Chamaesiphon minutus (strain ATCC 27169 / PCC 6605) TaxID=1173020 RepID=K9UAS1_CHAP6|nr:hypothetical protein [Chamaesiphon minutus]AFY92212.1 hypothetical protein Cha6605_0961 [Chamaesiphon minutus PCC 6605]
MPSQSCQIFLVDAPWSIQTTMFKKKGAAIDVIPWESTDHAQI